MDSNRIAERARQVREAIAKASVEVTSDDHAVTVVVGPGGAIRDFQLSPRAFQRSGAELGDIVVRTISAANTRMSERMSARMAEIMGGPAGRWGGMLGELPTPAQLRAELDREDPPSRDDSSPNREGWR